MEKLEQLDQDIFLYLNEQHNTFWDAVMVFVSNKYVWIPFYLALIVYLVYRYRRQSMAMLGMAIAAVGLADFVASGIFKPFFARPRPCHDADISAMVNFIDGCGGQFGFMSSHASTAFALAVFFNLILSDRYAIFKVVLVVWAVVVSYSRIYLGVHYPGDVVGGALLGSFLAYLSALCYQILLNKYPQLKR
ncbi:phosphatase PAP2 family protein [Pontibacter harenae]|uniref:phosphatase PAP2 family protein n=1 Tax=Pontibacter harenae TaxID=2894083 RepID=UPI001E3DC728|nr:phosphatase PAP2 family protein [Pontibacter harenae]MCC9167046.1 phosphatase PAP2 family protein [Pontibacter harenae]